MSDLPDSIAADVRAVLDSLGPAPTGAPTPAASRQRLIDETPAMWPQPEPVDEVADVVVPSPDGGVPARRYRAGAQDGPVVVFLHGGGWMSGDLDTHDGLCRAIAVRAGATVLSVDYRRTPEHRFPAALDDAIAATQWLATETGRAPIVMGDSSGATLALGVALAARREAAAPAASASSAAAAPALSAAPPQPAGMVLLYPPLEPRTDSPSHARFADGPRLTQAAMAWFWREYLGAADTDDELAAPARASDLQGLPPTLIALADHDPLHDEGADFARHLASAGVEVETIAPAGMVHGFARLQETAGAQLVLDAVAAAVLRWTAARAG